MTYLSTGHQIRCDRSIGCAAFFDTDAFNGPVETRRLAALAGWQTNVAQPWPGRHPRLDYCPKHTDPSFRPLWRETSARGVCARCGKDRPLVRTRAGELVLDVHTPRQYDPAHPGPSCRGTHTAPLLQS